MGYYIGQFYFDKRDIFLLVVVLGLALSIHYDYPIPYFEKSKLIFLVLLFLLAKGFISPAKDTTILITFFTALILSLFLPTLQLIFFVFFAMIFLKLFRLI